jgi:hypothetical protein
LAENQDCLVDEMKRCGIAVPVGIVVDATDRMGSALYRAALLRSGMTQEEADRQLSEATAQLAEGNQFPTATLVVPWEVAEQLLPLTSPTAAKNLREMKAEYRIGRSAWCLVVGVGSGGNTYGIAEIPELPRPRPDAEDGQHRHGRIHFPRRM